MRQGIRYHSTLPPNVVKPRPQAGSELYNHGKEHSRPTMDEYHVEGPELGFDGRVKDITEEDQWPGGQLFQSKQRHHRLDFNHNQ